MNRATAINAIKCHIGRGDNCKYKTVKEAAEAVGVHDVQFSRVLNNESVPIPQKMLDIAGLEAVKPPTTYRRKVS